MSNLKVCFTGVGSIAKRHIRNLNSACEKRGVSIQIDAFRRNIGVNPINGIHKSYDKYDELPSDYDAVFITNPTELHFNTLKLFQNKGKHFFIEKPVVSTTQIEDAKSFLPHSDCVYYVACPLRYNAVIQYIKKNINPDDIISVRCISSSYLPDWRPGQDYKETYSAHKNMGGGVSIDLIHEWDYMTYLLGWPNKVLCMIGKKSPLEIDSDDFAIYIADFDKYIAELHLDYFGRKTIRKIELITKNDTIIGDIANNKITYLSTGEVIDFNEQRDDFQLRETNHFLDMILGVTEAENEYIHAIKVLELTQGRINNEVITN